MKKKKWTWPKKAPFLILSFHPYSRTHSFFFHFIWLLVAADAAVASIMFCTVLFRFTVVRLFFFSSPLFLSLSRSRYTFICLNLTQFAFPLSYTRPLSFLFTRSFDVTPVFIALLFVHMQTTTLANTHNHTNHFFALFCFYFISLYFATTAWVYFGYFLCVFGFVCVFVWIVRFVSFVLYGGIVYTYLFVPFGIIIGFLFVVCVAIFMST